MADNRFSGHEMVCGISCQLAKSVVQIFENNFYLADSVASVKIFYRYCRDPTVGPESLTLFWPTLFICGNWSSNDAPM